MHRSRFLPLVTAAWFALGMGAFTPAASALDCTDFPAGGVQVNSVGDGGQTDLALVHGPGDILHAAWADARSGPAEVYYAQSTDGGLTFGAGRRVSQATLPITGTPVIDVDAMGTIAIGWAGEEAGDVDVYVVRSIDGGATFAPEVRANDWDRGDESFPALRLTPGGIAYVGWIEHLIEGSPSVRLARALPGQPFEASTRVNTGPVYSSCECCIIDLAIIGEEEVYVAFMANLDYVRDLYVSRSSDGGQTFADPVQVNEGHWFEPGCPTSGPRLDIGPAGDLHIVWVDRHDNAPLPSVYHARSTDGGQTFLHRTALNQPGDYLQGHPDFAVTPDGVVHAVWEAINDATFLSNLEYAYSTDGGTTFSTPCALSGGAVHTESLPVVARTPGGGLAIGWHDDRAGDTDCYVTTAQAVAGAASAGAPPTRAWPTAAPNPFTSSLRIDLPAADVPSALAIYDAQGRLVRDLLPDGARVEWNGRDSRGAAVPAGVYFLKHSASGGTLRVTRLN